MLDSGLPADIPWMLTPPGTRAFSPSTNSSSPQELTGSHSNCGFLALSFGVQGPTSLLNTWVPWGSMKIEPWPRCAVGGCVMLGAVPSPGRAGKKDKLEGTPIILCSTCPPVKYGHKVYYLSQLFSTGGRFAPPPRGHLRYLETFLVVTTGGGEALGI